MFHVLLNKIPSIYENSDIIGSYMESDDPLKYVLMNTATFSSTNSSTAKLDVNDQLVPKIRIWNGMDILSSATSMDEASADWTNDSYILSQQSPDLTFCPLTPPNLVGPIRIWMDGPSLDSIEKLYPYLEPGGHGKPVNCVVIIIQTDLYIYIYIYTT
uniref:Alpha-carbonic anhydrase domain-containing protein n=1 Tax=Heterorhabditis bacteriophora TaxID=37862 RepID=A0A1I7XMN6_HETBA